jgi:hypothetical protein
MSERKKSFRALSAYTRQLLDILDAYVAETGNHDVDNNMVAAWAYSKGLLQPQRADVVKQLARALSRAARQDYVEDEKGEPVRVRHPYRILKGEKQEVFWFKIDDTTPEKMRLSSQQRRKGMAADVFQADRDLKYYNKNFNPGDPILLSWNFDPDVAEREQSGEYDDNPPDED